MLLRHSPKVEPLRRAFIRSAAWSPAPGNCKAVAEVVDAVVVLIERTRLRHWITLPPLRSPTRAGRPPSITASLRLGGSWSPGLSFSAKYPGEGSIEIIGAGVGSVLPPLHVLERSFDRYKSDLKSVEREIRPRGCTGIAGEHGPFLHQFRMGTEPLRHHRQEMGPVRQISRGLLKCIVNREARPGLVKGHHGSTDVLDPLQELVVGLARHTTTITDPDLAVSKCRSATVITPRTRRLEMLRRQGLRLTSGFDRHK